MQPHWESLKEFPQPPAHACRSPRSTSTEIQFPRQLLNRPQVAVWGQKKLKKVTPNLDSGTPVSIHGSHRCGQLLRLI